MKKQNKMTGYAAQKHSLWMTMNLIYMP